jgi:ribose 5-phosphate isomerase B
MSKIAIACDHAGVALKLEVIAYLKALGHEAVDHGANEGERVDYPDYAKLVAADVAEQKADRGILICGTGIGMALTACKFKGIRAASVIDIYSTEMTRKHNDLNVLCLGARVVGAGLALRIVDAFLHTEFEGGRHLKRVEKIEG